VKALSLERRNLEGFAWERLRGIAEGCSSLFVKEGEGVAEPVNFHEEERSVHR
jgi:hypothetical protein